MQLRLDHDLQRADDQHHHSAIDALAMPVVQQFHVPTEATQTGWLLLSEQTVLVENNRDHFPPHHRLLLNVDDLFVDYALLPSNIPRNQSHPIKESSRKFILWFVRTPLLCHPHSLCLSARLGKTTRFIRLGDKLKETIDSQSSTQLQFYIERTVSIQINFTANRRANFGTSHYRRRAGSEGATPHRELRGP